MAIIWAAKSAGDTRPYGIDWAPILNGDTISASVLAVESGTVTIVSQANTTTTTTCVLSGGVNGETVEFSATITTAAGLIFVREVCLAITACITDIASSSTKAQIIEMGYEEAGQAGYEFNASANELASGLRKLDALMAEWKADGIDLSYNFPATFGQSDLNEDSGIPDACVNGVAAWLGYRIMPSQGKSPMGPSMGALALAKVSIRAQTLRVPTVQLPDWTPRGAGNGPWSTYYPFVMSSGDCVACGDA